MNISSEHTKPKILVVDDQPINIKLLQRKLEREGMQVDCASNGIECLERVKNDKPDLILLDVMMPEMDGVEACKHLKADSETRSIPVMFITAKSTKEGKLEGLSIGAADYITKPIDLEETIARVRTQLNIQAMHRENIELQKRLGEARRTAAVGAITQGIAHNLNNLLGVAVGYLDLLKHGADNPDMVNRSVKLMDQAISRMVTIVRQLSSIATSEKIALAPTCVADLIQSSIERFQTETDMKPAFSVELDLPEEFKVSANVEVFETILGKLFANAYESYPDKQEHRPIQVKAEMDTNSSGKRIHLHVIDEGMGLDDEVTDNLFDPFVTSKSAVGRGLGLTMARHAIRNINGNLIVQNREDASGVIATINILI